MYAFGLKIKARNRYCRRCHSQVYHSDVFGYPYVCHSCDENLYGIETDILTKAEHCSIMVLKKVRLFGAIPVTYEELN